MIVATVVTEQDDIEALVQDINNSQWDESNDMAAYQPDALRLYLRCQGTVFMACYEEQDNRVLLGIASARIEMKPYDEERWLYIDELDVCADQRRRGAGRMMMNALLNLADRELCEEVWLGTETGNIPAQALYQSLGPDEVEKFVGYTYEID